MALILLLGFLLFVVVGRIVIQYVTTGDHGIRLIKASAPFTVKLSSILLLIAFLAISSLCVLNWMHVLGPHVQPHLAFEVVGTVLGILGIVIAVTSQFQMGKSWRFGVDEGETTRLVMTGLYAYVRNPIYSGILIFGMGLLLVLPSWYMVFSIGVLYVAIDLHVRYAEEPYLKQTHGDVFADYVKRTGRYWPKFTKRI